MDFIRTAMKTTVVAKPSVDITNPEELKEHVKEEIKVQGRRYYTSTLFATGTLFLLNALLLYFGTISGVGRIDLARFYGFKEGRNAHLQRTAGISSLVIAIVNYMPIIMKKDNQYLLGLAFVIDVCSIIHYAIETLVFQGIRLEIMICMGLFLVMNIIWTFKEVYQSRNSVQIKKVV